MERGEEERLSDFMLIVGEVWFTLDHRREAPEGISVREAHLIDSVSPNTAIGTDVVVDRP
jgi:hypothetical protein